ncbi:MAG: hypothetical protein K2P65_07715 [Lachnospiraceae bacterium]|nr:hypothetical protein [Lachnospiraceae bacterium]
MRIGKERKRELEKAFEAPKPMNKKAFLAQLPKAQIGYREFMFYQIAYMPKRVWLISASIFGISLYGAWFMQRSMIWAISAMMPFAALTVTTENARSAAYGMEELEMAARFSLRSIVLARLGVLGIFHLLLLILLVCVGNRDNAYTLLQSGIYLTVPYLATTFFGLAVSRKVHGKEVIYICMGIAVTVSGFYGIAGRTIEIAYQSAYFGWWLAAFFAFALGLASEYHKIIRQTEELAWNLQ